MNKHSLSLLIYGLFTVLCQSAFLFVWVESQSDALPADVLLHRYASFLEYPLMSLLLIVGGALLVHHAVESQKTP